MCMGIIRTDKWIEEGYSIQEKILELLELRDQSLLLDLRRNGLSSNNYSSQQIFSQMKRDQLWDSAEEIFQKYRKAFNGPDVPIFLLPSRSSIFLSARKSGVAYKKMVFLFVPSGLDLKELEALFVHEYHHTSRLHKLSGDNDTLLGTLIMEGLAEKAVEEFCGKAYLAPWVTSLQESQINQLIEKVYQPNFEIKKSERLHGDLLYGTRQVPKMAGYAVGYQLVDKFCQRKKLNTKQMLSLPAIKFLPVSTKQ